VQGLLNVQGAPEIGHELTTRSLSGTCVPRSGLAAQVPDIDFGDEMAQFGAMASFLESSRGNP